MDSFLNPPPGQAAIGVVKRTVTTPLSLLPGLLLLLGLFLAQKLIALFS